ncbi:hypothetical protein L2E82_19804 [Cichorium intybus]|uniref:Uncharacterized protein n=1 Tax=Cichorium intybus TaxID=13427 RepID=A0ACB9DRL6_CICIN|nr:hypothetical protein L2E82_19804 [Cichorium intybus]
MVREFLIWSKMLDNKKEGPWNLAAVRVSSRRRHTNGRTVAAADDSSFGRQRVTVYKVQADVYRFSFPLELVLGFLTLLYQRLSH